MSVPKERKRGATVRLSSYGTAGARRRMRWHSRKHVPLTFTGRYAGRKGAPDLLMFRADGDDGRTYELGLLPADVEVVTGAGRKR